MQDTVRIAVTAIFLKSAWQSMTMIILQQQIHEQMILNSNFTDELYLFSMQLLAADRVLLA